MSKSTPSIPFTASERESVTPVEGLCHVEGRLEARKYKSPSFTSSLLQIVTSMNVSTWCNRVITAADIRVTKVSGALTNAVFFVSCPSIPGASTLLLRVYGPSSGSLISRPRELEILHVLSSKYKIGPLIYGTFDNGRIEQYFDSVALNAPDLRDPVISRWIATRMAELHQVDVDDVEGPSPSGHEDSVKKNVVTWLPHAREVLSLPTTPPSFSQTFNIDAFADQWEKYMRRISRVEAKEGASRRVLAHNDTQYGNLLRMNPHPRNPKGHRQIIVVDFEYAGPNPAAFDIANHFMEWTANYHGPAPHLLDPVLYPTLDQRRNFYKSYVMHANPSISEAEREEKMNTLEKQVQMWGPASDGMWAVWGVVQAGDSLEVDDGGEPEFDYLGYARCRLERFQRGLKDLDLSV
ncbi:kinase-like protein [Thelephora ganbajun]|uniref:Kinase-like protein n=1 Tax=Thelephora ganbajun TaxID=370292 RepID=A0ACB6ZGS0_THEGA|nr:kinase-like protein [Thelephora ganbajun]